MRILNCFILITLLSACQSDNGDTTAPNTASEVVETSSGTLTAEERQQRREQRRAEHAARREQRLAELTPEQRAEREARRLARNSERNSSANQVDASLADDAAQREARRERNLNQRLQQKAWWNKSNKLGNLDISETQVDDLNASLSKAMDSRKILAEELEPLWQSNRDALTSGDLNLIASNLKRIDSLETQWAETKREATLEMLSILDQEQLNELAQSGGEITSLNWLDIDLGRGINRPQSSRREKKEQRRLQREQQRSSNNQ